MNLLGRFRVSPAAAMGGVFSVTRVGTFDVILDGSALTDQLYGGGSVQRPPSLDSIQEFHVETNSTSASSRGKPPSS